MTDGRERIRTPSLETVLEIAIAHCKSSLRVAMPAKIETYDAATQKANVKPLIQDSFLDDEGNNVVEPLPVVADVPVVFPRGGGFYLTFPLAPGDFVLLVALDRSIDKFATGEGEDTDPVDLRTHDLTDVVAFAGFYPFTKAIADPVDKHVLLGFEGGSVIAVKDDGQVHLGSIDAADWVALATKTKTEITAVRNTLNALVTAYNAHVHTGTTASACTAGGATGTCAVTSTPSQGVAPAAVGDVKADKTKAD